MQTLTKRKERIFKQLRTKYEQNESNVNPLFFLLEVEHLFPDGKEVVSFFGKAKGLRPLGTPSNEVENGGEGGEAPSEDQERGRAFESIASRYYPLVGRKLPKGCDCGGIIEQNNDYCVCDTCCKVSTVIESSSRLPNRVSNYDRKPKFRECLSRYQARQDVVIDKRPYEKYLSKHYGDLSKITKKQIFHMLINLGKEDQVKHIHLIHYEMTGVPPNNIDYLVASLMHDFEVLMRLYDDKKGVVSVRQVFYHLLKKNGVPCCKEEFGLRKEDKSLDELLSENPPSTTSSNDRYRS